MKCSVCGGDYGNGNFCQSCGTDRVSALGNYSGYSSANINQPHPVNDNDHSNESNICWNCGEVIPLSSKFCPFCSTPLVVECPKCGHTYSSRYPACSNCGTNREQYINEQNRIAEEEAQRRQIEEAEQLRKRRMAEKAEYERKSYDVDEAYEVLKDIAYRSDVIMSFHRHEDRYFRYLRQYLYYNRENKILLYVNDKNIFLHPDDNHNMKEYLEKLAADLRANQK